MKATGARLWNATKWSAGKTVRFGSIVINWRNIKSQAGLIRHLKRHTRPTPDSVNALLRPLKAREHIFAWGTIPACVLIGCGMPAYGLMTLLNSPSITTSLFMGVCGMVGLYFLLMAYIHWRLMTRSLTSDDTVLKSAEPVFRKGLSYYSSKSGDLSLPALVDQREGDDDKEKADQ